MKNILLNIAVIIAALSATTNWAAGAPKADSPKTKLEQFSAKYGLLILQAETETIELYKFPNGETVFVGGRDGYYQVTVKVVELIQPSSKTRAYGVRFEFVGLVGKSNSWLDEDEIPSLIKGIDYLLDLDPKVTKLSKVTGIYRTKDGMEVHAFKGEKTVLGLKAKTGSFAVFENVTGLKAFRKALQTAQAKITEIKP